MDATAMMTRLAEVVDAQAWSSLAELLDEELVCRYVHTGEVFDRDAWVRLNSDYPGFDHLELRDCVATATRDAGRSHATALAGQKFQHLEVDTSRCCTTGSSLRWPRFWTDADEENPGRPATPRGTPSRLGDSGPVAAPPAAVRRGAAGLSHGETDPTEETQ